MNSDRFAVLERFAPLFDAPSPRSSGSSNDATVSAGVATSRQASQELPPRLALAAIAARRSSRSAATRALVRTDRDYRRVRRVGRDDDLDEL